MSTELKRAASLLQRRQLATDEARQALYVAIRKAHHEQGLSVRAIAAATGLTFGRIGQILKAGKPSSSS